MVNKVANILKADVLKSHGYIQVDTPLRKSVKRGQRKFRKKEVHALDKPLLWTGNAVLQGVIYPFPPSALTEETSVKWLVS